MALARVVNTVFFLLTSAYCLLTYNAFAYRQFVKPHLVSWLTDFVIWHHLGYWACLAMTAVTLRPRLSAGGGRRMGQAYLAVSTLVGIALLARPVLPQVENDWRGLVLALLALVFPTWLAVTDHVTAPMRAAHKPSSTVRVCNAWLVAGAVVWAAQTAAMPWRMDRSGDIPLTASDLAYGAATSGAAHAVAFVALASLVAAVLWMARRTVGPWAEYWTMAMLVAVAITFVCVRVIFAALAFAGPTAWMVGASLAIALTAMWSGLAHVLVASGDDRATGVDRWLVPLPGSGSRAVAAVALALSPLVTAVAVVAVEPVDWDFLLQKLCVVSMWLVVFSYAYAALPPARPDPAWRTLAGPPALAAMLFGGRVLVEPRLTVPGSHTGFVPSFVLEGYAAVDPSFRLIEDLSRRTSPEDATFFGVLRAHTAIQHVEVEPISIDFVQPSALSGGSTPTLRESPPGSPQPHVFVFVVDSLRRDYLEPYNARVDFTPSIARLAADSVVFERAFTRYGGTGLSVPAIWSGSMLLHKQYVTPFAPMNALMKLLHAERYQRVMSLDSVMAPLLAPTNDAAGGNDGTVPDLIELDRDVPVVDYDLCRTLAELRQRLPASLATSRPIFAYTLPQNLHISRVRSKPVPVGRSYAGFVAPVAAELERMDACLGSFVDNLRGVGIYDDSVIVLTADHGDSLGEWLRWGHSYTMFPEVIRIPLIVHVPPRLRERFSWDADRVALSTDITPSLYALLGHQPADRGPLFGRSLFQLTTRASESGADEPQLLASSYGAVYAVLRGNGSLLYLADGINQREYAYDLSTDQPIRVGVTLNARETNRAFIRSRLDQLAGMYRFHPAL